ncbi:MAG: phosphatidylcholine/phosphatidylserine synthase [Alphaproteobacteria bacterium]|nr:phosphatidylcholine/phosphatidylserine synthase [Alphaproteobacteria bacterium]NCB49696.1 phosphatidylcholine/phosphatidylserine synthase [Alphaproteobacteria bacterium]
MQKRKSVLEIRKPTNLQIRQLFPNSVTMMALACGVSSFNFAFWGKWEYALLSIIFAAIFDGLDGRVARMLKVASRFGEELDSLSDFVSFGVAPGFLLYQWTMDQAARSLAISGDFATISQAVGMRWFFVLFLAMCCAMRLARFNTMLQGEEQPSYWKHFFVGLPAPGGALVALLPLTLWLQFNLDFLRDPLFVSFFMLLSGVLMASRVPTICLKKLHFSETGAICARLIIILMIATAFVYPWLFLGTLGSLYVLTLPVGIYYFLKFRKQTLNV